MLRQIRCGPASARAVPKMEGGAPATPGSGQIRGNQLNPRSRSSPLQHETTSSSVVHIWVAPGIPSRDVSCDRTWRDSDGQRIGSIGIRSFGQPEKGAHHERDLVLSSGAAADRGRFDPLGQHTRKTGSPFSAAAKMAAPRPRPAEWPSYSFGHRSPIRARNSPAACSRIRVAKRSRMTTRHEEERTRARIMNCAVIKRPRFAVVSLDDCDAGVAKGSVNGENTHRSSARYGRPKCSHRPVGRGAHVAQRRGYTKIAQIPWP